MCLGLKTAKAGMAEKAKRAAIALMLGMGRVPAGLLKLALAIENPWHLARARLQ